MAAARNTVTTPESPELQALLGHLLEAGADVNVTKAWTQTPAAKNDGDLWPVVENALARAYGGQSPKGATKRTRATDGPCRQ